MTILPSFLSTFSGVMDLAHPPQPDEGFTHLRVGEPPVKHVMLGIVLWGGLWLREPRRRVLMPLVK